MHLLVFGLGFSGAAIARLAVAAGWQVTATSRSPQHDPPGIRMINFRAAAEAIEAATHILATAPPREDEDPVLARYAAEIAAAPKLAWIGYLSTTGVYGDRQGGWVDEITEPAPGAERSQRRLAAEQAWRTAAEGRPLDICRLAGIYGPGRSIFDDLRQGRARRVIQPGHAFGRIHVDDIAEGVMAAIAHPPQGTRILNFSDDEPAESAVVTEYAAQLADLEVPPAIPFETARAGMSEMALSFWAENRRVRSEATKAALGRPWRYPTYREGLAAILAQERCHQAAQ